MQFLEIFSFKNVTLTKLVPRPVSCEVEHITYVYQKHTLALISLSPCGRHS